MIHLFSQSPQRRDILNELDIEFTVSAVECDETTAASPAGTVQKNACLKAAAAWRSGIVPENDLILTADTVMACGGHILGKPENAGQAEQYLRMISGNRVEVWSGIAIIRAGESRGLTTVESAAAVIRNLSDAEIAWYIATGEPLTRAGAFGISRRGEIFIESLQGSYSCFAGLPKRTLAGLFAVYEVPGFAGMPAAETLPQDFLSFTPAAAE